MPHLPENAFVGDYDQTPDAQFAGAGVYAEVSFGAGNTDATDSEPNVDTGIIGIDYDDYGNSDGGSEPLAAQEEPVEPLPTELSGRPPDDIPPPPTNPPGGEYMPVPGDDEGGDGHKEAGTVPDEPLQPAPRTIEQQRVVLSKALIRGSGAARYLVGAENRRVEKLLNERYADPYASQQQQIKAIAAELDISRELIRQNTTEGIDDVAVDARLNLRTDGCILPPLFQELHRRAEEEAGSGITFLKWMTNHTTDEQLMNVWQWHDKYLIDLDSDPAFKERIASVKANYAEGSRQTIAAGILHPDMTVQEPTMEAVRVCHGSPFSPVLAVAHAFADRESLVVQMHEGISDFRLYHEMTHLLAGGMHFEFNEGATDLIAAEVYNHSHPEPEHVDPRSLEYSDQVATLDTIKRMTEGKIDLYNLSRTYSGPNASTNTLLFTAQVDAAVGLPITIPLLRSSNEFIETSMSTYNGGVVRLAAQLLMRRQIEFLEAMMFDAQGNKVATTTGELAARIISKDTLSQYDQATIMDGLSIVLETHKLQELLS